ncbi:MAG: GIY-YIG nuclease family protein [Elusimicrobiota bacterium]
MLKLLDIIPIKEDNLSEYKLHFAIGAKSSNKKEPLYELSRNKFKEWQEYQQNTNFKRKYILSLIYYGKNEWIFGGIYESKDVTWVEDHYSYDTELLDKGKDMIGRLVIEYDKYYRQSYCLLEKWYDELVVKEILREPYTSEPFPGYENVLLDFESLKIIIDEEAPSWRSPLSSIKGVYVITDKETGKQYVGSAYGENNFWTRWSDYASNCHGGNKELIKIIERKGEEYADNFQFSILEIRPNTIGDKEVKQRESHWKDVLGSREFGYNEN